SMFLSDVEEMLYAMLRRNNQITAPHLNYSMFVMGVQGRRLLNPVFKGRNAQHETDVVAKAREAELKVDMRNKLIKVHMKIGEIWSKNETTSQFDDHIFDVDMPEDFIKQGLRRPRDMTWRELSHFKAEYRNEKSSEEEAADKLEPLINSGKATKEDINH